MLLRVCAMAAVVACCTSATALAASPTWLAPEGLSPSGVAANSPQVAMSAGGDVAAVWLRDGIRLAFRPAGGPTGASLLLGPGSVVSRPDVGFDPAGRAIVVWSAAVSGGEARILRLVRGADGTLSEPTQISRAGGPAAGFSRLVVAKDGTALATWFANEGGVYSFVAAAQPPGGEFGTPVVLGAADGGFFGDVAFDPAGNAFAVWQKGNAVMGAARPAGGTFQPAAPVVTAPMPVDDPRVALGAGGQVVVGYRQDDPALVTPNPSVPKSRPWVIERPAGAAAFGAPQDLTVSPSGASLLDVAVTPAGESVAVQQSAFYPFGAAHAAGDTFPPPVRLSPVAHDLYSRPVVEAAPDGTTHVSWQGNGSDGAFLRHVTRAPGQGFSAMATLPGSVNTVEEGLAVDAEGNAAALWTQREAGFDRVVLSGHDAAGPQLRNLSVPATGAPGAPLAFGVTPVDVWSPVASSSWSFGDGGTADGAAVTHAYAVLGT
ncbi:MAG: hypothetical protein H0V81_08315, partial [Solirubrobacterales bacterium]|nr:hypothetical protein [Solirubrobacterales bacterium]